MLKESSYYLCKVSTNMLEAPILRFYSDFFFCLFLGFFWVFFSPHVLQDVRYWYLKKPFVPQNILAKFQQNCLKPWMFLHVDTLGPDYNAPRCQILNIVSQQLTPVLPLHLWNFHTDSTVFFFLIILLFICCCFFCVYYFFVIRTTEGGSWTTTNLCISEQFYS